ncbi:MAG TPA: YncE family protein [Bryobacteraceae bacterium]|jgi:YVTN family beta-propeller protein|nr:YncE family protein [Bryobacteraceae bacterium]
MSPALGLAIRNLKMLFRQADLPAKSFQSRIAAKFSRRVLLTSVLASACGRKRGPRYQGWLFVASGTEKKIAVADLASFRRVSSIPLPYAPDQLFRAGNRVFAVCREGQALLEIDIERFEAGGRIPLPGKPLGVRLLADSDSAIVAADGPSALLRVDLTHRKVVAKLPLPGTPGDLDLNESRVALTIPSRNAVVRVSLPQLQQFQMLGSTDVGVSCRAIGFRRDGKTILAGSRAAREIVAIDAESGQLLSRLPLPVAPSRFCFIPNGGQMFVTGEGQTAIAIVSPFQNEVAETILAGSSPYAMVVEEKRNLLFVTNPASGDLTILDIETRAVSASVHVGENPGEILLTPDGEYALVLDQRSGNVSVVRIRTVLDRKAKTNSPPAPLFTVFPTAADARAALIVPFPA